MSYSLLRQLLPQLERFAQQERQDDIRQFARWLSQEFEQDPTQTDSGLSESSYPVNQQIAANLGKLEAYTKHYMKGILRQTVLASNNDYLFLIILEQLGEQRKSELVKVGIMEISSGIEVIRRLLRHGLIEDYPDPDDGRSKRVRLTEAGRALLTDLRPAIDRLGQILTGPLTITEKHQLLSLLQKLDSYHQPIWEHDSESDFRTILEKYPPRKAPKS